MIKEAYCSFEVSKLLKEKEFEGECIAYYSKYKDNNLNLYRWGNRQTYVNVRNNGYTLVPTQQMAMKWLREVHNIFIVIRRGLTGTGWVYSHEIYKDSKCWYAQYAASYDTYEEGVETALKFCLENLI